MIKKIVLLSFCFLVLSLSASPLQANGGCGSTDYPGSRCCPADSCYGGNYGQLDCIGGRLCCQSCTPGTPLGTIGEGEGFGPFANIPDLSTAAGYFTKILSNIIGVMTIIAGIWFIFQFIIGGYGWLTAGGDKAGVQAAQSRMTNAFIGLTVVVAAYAIIYIIGELLGFEILHPERLIELVGPG